jgi:hypothetical protein
MKNLSIPHVKLTKFEYDETTSTLDVEIKQNNKLNKLVGATLNLGRDATHEESEKYIVEIIVKALEKKDGYDFQKAEKDQEENDHSV